MVIGEKERENFCGCGGKFLSSSHERCAHDRLHWSSDWRKKKEKETKTREGNEKFKEEEDYGKAWNVRQRCSMDVVVPCRIMSVPHRLH